MDGATTNIWALPASGGAMRPLTDFQGRPTLIARQISWSPDGGHIYAAVAENGGDIVMYEGLI
jgi:Tol biopolymer transport system component